MLHSPCLKDDLTAIVARCKGFSSELKRLQTEQTRETPLSFQRTCLASLSFYTALIAHSLAKSAKKKKSRIWLVCDALPMQERMSSELRLWTQAECISIPEQEIHINNGLSDPELVAERLHALKRISQPAKQQQIIIVTRAALYQFAPRFTVKENSSIQLRCGREYGLDALAKSLEQADFERVDQVSARGEWSLRGGIMDVFPLQSAWPLRLEFFGDELESIRAFDIDSQLSFKKLDEAELVLHEPEASERLEDWITDTDTIIACPGAGIAGDVHFFEIPPDLPTGVVGNMEEQLADDRLASFASPLGSFETGDFVMQEAKRALAQRQLTQWQKEKWRIVMYFPHQGEKERFHEICGHDEAWMGVEARDGDLPFGFSIPAAKLAIISAAEIFGRYSSPHARQQANREEQLRRERAQAPLREIEEGDLVIHASHGLGRFVTIQRHEQSGEEELHIQYAGDVLLRIPLNQSHLVSKYVGLGGKTPELSRLGDARWQKACAAAQRAIADYASQLLEVHAERESKPGLSHPADSSWMWQFESSFPYRETPDQLRAINQTKADMEAARPMDRLICGDVGFGKTEVAIRAAFKCVTGGHQAAILAPTTVLADQHWRTFRARMSEYPVRIELLSRFTSAKKTKEIIAGLAAGEVDIVVGTHKLVSKTVKFMKLGLVVIDEEQRFGVKHKEQFKRNFRMVDMLTLSATPIPRTLYSALMGARDMSTIETAPLNRIPVQTAVCPYDDELIQKAIERELERNGQVFFLHNRVGDMEQVRAHLQSLVPQARIVIGHGQMDKSDLEIVMRDFVAGKADVLLSTTIIESGIDIPNANTIIIDRADRFGLADLYQLRGRVGRGGHRAYAYLLLPREAVCTGDARKRVNAIKEYTELGSGFKIAMRDLEIRGAGNLLGTQQSGHIAAIGFDLYCQLLKQSIQSLQGKRPDLRHEARLKADFLYLSEASHQRQDKSQSLGAYIPSHYIDSTQMRMSVYTQLARAMTLDDIDDCERQWIDRFGPIPAEARHLLTVHKIKILASRSRISDVEISAQKLMLTRHGDYILIDKRFPRLRSITPAEKLKETLRLLLKNE